LSSFDLFIQRPVLTLMMTLSLIVFGVLGYTQLGVEQFPDMDFPVVTVTALLEGASPEVVEQDVTDILEEHINTIAGVRTLSSKSINGASSIKVEFELGTDIDIAAQDVRDKVARARFELPPDVEPPVVNKEDFGDQPVLWFPVNSNRPLVEVSEWVRDHMKPRLETIPGVASAELFGNQDRAIRIWLDGDAMHARGLSAGDVLVAIGREHVEIPGGRVEGRTLEYSVKTDAEFRSVAELESLIVAWIEGAPIRLGDVARVEDGAADVETLAQFDGIPTVAVGIRKQSGANTVAVVDEVFRRLDELRSELPTGYSLKENSGAADFSRPIRESVDETIFALIFGAALAVLTVLVFLRRARPTMIVGAAIPISLITTFGMMWLFGFTLNTMTLLALALAVGVVIDDAIVVLENIERHRTEGDAPFAAASKGTREIAFAATAATIAIAVVFLPVIFVEGIVGSFLSEFGATVACAVMISLFVALTLTPMLAARMPEPKERPHGGFYHRLETSFAWLERRYAQMLDWCLGHRALTLCSALASFVLALGVGSQLGAEFFPPADNGLFFMRFETAAGTPLQTTREYLLRNEEWILAQPELAGAFSGVGTGGGNSAPVSNQGMIFGILKSKRDRERTTQELIPAAREALQAIPGQEVQIYDLSNMSGGGTGSFTFEIRGNRSLDELDRLSDTFMARMREAGGFVDLTKSLKLGLPEVRVTPNRDKSAAMGVDARTVATTIQAMIGGLDVATFKEAGKRYDIRVRLEADAREEPSAIERLYVRNVRGDVVELGNLVDITTGASPSAITRTDRQRSVAIAANLDERSLDEAIDTVASIAEEILPEGVTFNLSADAEAFMESISQFGLAIGLAVLVIYMVLAAQFESLVHPLTVMLALPLAMVGALGALFAAGMTLNLFSLIGIILLMGLVTKNSILLVDYANQLRDGGLSKVEAMRTAAPIRMRPVLMTALSMIFGVLPAAIGVGPGAETRAPMAVAVAAGMFSSTLLTLIVVPVFYVVLDDAVEKLRAMFRRLRRPARA
jgi:HAE1 family hydrophobic/amphiphilic exporter-1